MMTKNFIAMIITASLLVLNINAANINKNMKDTKTYDSISAAIYENQPAIGTNTDITGSMRTILHDDLIANENISNRYLGEEETGCYVNDGSVKTDR